MLFFYYLAFDYDYVYVNAESLENAPDGTAAFAFIPFSNSTSTCTVGFPLESNISIAFTFAIFPHLLFTKITSFFYI